MRRKERRMDIEDLPYEGREVKPEEIVIHNSPSVYTRAVCVVSSEKTIVAFGRADGMKRVFAI